VLKLRKPSSKRPGLPQGTLVHVGTKYSEDVKISLIRYGQEKVEQIEVKSVKECANFLDNSSILWLNIVGIHDIQVMQQIGELFSISNLTLEDIMNTNQQPKIEEFENYLFLVMRPLYYGETHKKLNYENLAIILGKNFVISFQEKENFLFKGIIERLQDSNSTLRKRGADYLMCSIIDSTVDHYFPTLEHLGLKMEKIEERIISKIDEKILSEIYRVRQEIILFSKIVHPEREVLNSLLHKGVFVDEKTLRYIQDVYEHVIHLIESVDTYRDNITGLRELYHSTLSNRMNEVMKMLTVIASLFIPITFIVGLYGMNFQYMPEYSSPIAYPIVIITMIGISMSLFFYFKKKSWI
jgi:magnesium transporter